MDLVVSFLLVSAVAGIMYFATWYRQQTSLKIVAGLQGLVDKMKEYDLDTRAGLIICQDSNLRIQYIDPALQSFLGCPTHVD